MYAKDISKKVKSVQADKVRKGLFIGSTAPYGYRKDKINKNLLVIDETVAPVVKMIFDLYLDGKSLGEIAKILTDKGIETPSEYKHGSYNNLEWSKNKIKTILTSETYIGNMVQHKNKKINYKSKKRIVLPPSEWIIASGTHEAIIDSGSFYMAQKLLAQTSNVWETKHSHEYLLNGLVYCKDCGQKMQLLVRNRNGNEERHLRCGTYAKSPSSKLCESHYIKESVVTEAVLKSLNEHGDGAYVHEHKTHKNSGLHVNNEISILNNKISLINSNIDKAYMDTLSGLLLKEDFERISKTLVSKRDNLKTELKYLKDMKKSSLKPNDSVENSLKLKNPKKELLFELIERIEITKEKKVEIHYKL
jgi:hypothetical protein